MSNATNGKKKIAKSATRYVPSPKAMENLRLLREHVSEMDSATAKFIKAACDRTLGRKI
jgi:hypothetical protein